MGRSLVIGIVVGAFCDHKDVMMMTKTNNMIIKIFVWASQQLSGHLKSQLWIDQQNEGF